MFFSCFPNLVIGRLKIFSFEFLKSLIGSKFKNTEGCLVKKSFFYTFPPATHFVSLEANNMISFFTLPEMFQAICIWVRGKNTVANLIYKLAGCVWGRGSSKFQKY